MLNLEHFKKLSLVVTLILLTSLILACGGPQETLEAPPE